MLHRMNNVESCLDNSFFARKDEIKLSKVENMKINSLSFELDPKRQRI